MLVGNVAGSSGTLGTGAIVNDGAVVEDEVIIGAGCMVLPGKTLETGYVYVGNPCKQMRALSESEKSFFTYSPANYVKLKDQYLLEMNTEGQTER